MYATLKTVASIADQNPMVFVEGAIAVAMTSEGVGGSKKKRLWPVPRAQYPKGDWPTADGEERDSSQKQYPRK
jgi:hypothetical protein